MYCYNLLCDGFYCLQVYTKLETTLCYKQDNNNKLFISNLQNNQLIITWVGQNYSGWTPEITIDKLV